MCIVNHTWQTHLLLCLEQEIQTTLREEIKSACEYRPFEKCDYSARIANEISCKKVEYVLEKLDAMQTNIKNAPVNL